MAAMNLAGFLRGGGQVPPMRYPDVHDRNTISPDALMQDQQMRRDYPVEQDEISGERYALMPAPAAPSPPPPIPPWQTQVFPALPPWQTQVLRNYMQGR